MQLKKLFQNGFFMFLGFSCSMLPVSTVWAHGGVSVEIDSCRIPIGDQWVHFTGYTPTFTADTEYCNAIPDIGQTNLVFDYEGKLLRAMTVEFEITKEPEGTRIYYQEPKTHETGTINAPINFSQYGSGKYLAHVTLVNEGKTIDAHLPFTVGQGSGEFPFIPVLGVLLAILGIGSMMYLSDGPFKRKVDEVLDLS